MDNKNDLSHDEMLADSIFYDELDEESSYESDGGTKDLPKIVRGELDRRRRLRSASARGAPQDSCSDADADSRDDTKLKELEQPASPEIVEAFKNHVKEGSFGPHLYGGYLTIMERLGVTPLSTDPFVKDMKKNVWLFSLGDRPEEEERQLWQDMERQHRAKVRYLRYREFIERQNQKNKYNAHGEEQHILSTKDCFWSDVDNQEEYIGPKLTNDQIELQEQGLSNKILEKDETLPNGLLKKLGTAFTSGLWQYLNGDKISLGMGAGVSEVERPSGLNMQLPNDLRFLSFEVSEYNIQKQCEEIRKRYVTMKCPLGLALQKGGQKKKSGGNNKKGKNKRGKYQNLIQSHKSHEEAIQQHLKDLISLLEKMKDKSLAFGRTCLHIMNVINVGVLYDTAFSRTILCYNDGSIFKSLLRLRRFANHSAKSADGDITRSPACGITWWTLYAILSDMLAESIAQLHITQKSSQDVEMAGERFKNDFLPELLKNVKGPDNVDTWYSEDRAVWCALEICLVRLPEKNAIKFIKEFWDLLECACLRKFDEDIQKATFSCERIRAREVFMALKASADALSLVNSLSNFGMKESGNSVIPGPIAIKMIKKGVVKLLIKCCDDSRDVEISALAMSGLAQMSRVRDCRKVILQQPGNEGLVLVEKGLTCKHANKASAAMLLALHLAWDEEWRDPLRSIKPGIEKLCIKWATFCMASILEKAETLRVAEEKAKNSMTKELTDFARMSINGSAQDIMDKEEKARNDNVEKWTDIETQEKAGIINYTLSRSILLLSSSLLFREDLFHRLQQTDVLYLVSACNDIPIIDARNATATILNNYNAMLMGSPSPSQFPDPMHLLDGFIEQMRRSADEQKERVESVHIVMLVLAEFYASPKWKKYFKKLRNENEDAKFFIDHLISTASSTMYRRGAIPSSPVASRAKLKDEAAEIPEKCSTLVLASCGACGKVEEKRGEFKSCSRCQAMKYCGRECQKADWKVHKKVCKNLGH